MHKNFSNSKQETIATLLAIERYNSWDQLRLVQIPNQQPIRKKARPNRQILQMTWPLEINNLEAPKPAWFNPNISTFPRKLLNDVLSHAPIACNHDGRYLRLKCLSCLCLCLLLIPSTEPIDCFVSYTSQPRSIPLSINILQALFCPILPKCISSVSLLPYPNPNSPPLSLFYPTYPNGPPLSQ